MLKKKKKKIKKKKKKKKKTNLTCLDGKRGGWGKR
jgi:hypothetical protein